MTDPFKMPDVVKDYIYCPDAATSIKNRVALINHGMTIIEKVLVQVRHDISELEKMIVADEETTP